MLKEKCYSLPPSHHFSDAQNSAATVWGQFFPGPGCSSTSKSLSISVLNLEDCDIPRETTLALISQGDC